MLVFQSVNLHDIRRIRDATYGYQISSLVDLFKGFKHKEQLCAAAHLCLAGFLGQQIDERLEEMEFGLQMGGLFYFSEMFDPHEATCIVYYGFKPNMFLYRKTIKTTLSHILLALGDKIAICPLEQVEKMIEVLANLLNLPAMVRDVQVEQLATDVFYEATVQGKGFSFLFNFLHILFPERCYLLKFLGAICLNKSLAEKTFVVVITIFCYRKY